MSYTSFGREKIFAFKKKNYHYLENQFSNFMLITNPQLLQIVSFIVK